MTTAYVLSCSHGTHDEYCEYNLGVRLSLERAKADIAGLMMTDPRVFIGDAMSDTFEWVGEWYQDHRNTSYHETRLTITHYGYESAIEVNLRIEQFELETQP